MFYILSMAQQNLLPDQRKNEDKFSTVVAKFKLNNSPF